MRKGLEGKKQGRRESQHKPMLVTIKLVTAIAPGAQSHGDFLRGHVDCASEGMEGQTRCEFIHRLPFIFVMGFLGC